jgi:hypothetical protein
MVVTKKINQEEYCQNNLVQMYLYIIRRSTFFTALVIQTKWTKIPKLAQFFEESLNP